MESLKINLLNPKAKMLLEQLAELNLISIEEDNQNDIKSVLNRLRAKNKGTVNFDEITQEVELVRAKLYGKKA
ncbi:MAG: hypothetical protein SFW35_11325 [Chitinophagales bacterium]|nr:hypothetical protein [Chitinophagales bacterium]